MHRSGLNVAMMDGSVRSLRKGIHRQEITDPDIEGTLPGIDPSPRDIFDAIGSGAPLGVWDRLLLPRDGEAVQATDGSAGL
jgi:prepilin-type processing-associated H-X9-DG protein